MYASIKSTLKLAILPGGQVQSTFLYVERKSKKSEDHGGKTQHHSFRQESLSM
jgi:hypothetical protein